MPDLFQRADLWVIGIYMAAMLVVGFLVARSSNDVEGYAVGHRRMNGWVLGFSVLGTFTSSITFLSVPAQAYKENWNVYCFGLAMPLAAWIGTRWFVTLYRRNIRLSAFELFEMRFGYWARIYADACYIVLQTIRSATILLLVALAVKGMLGVDVYVTLFVSAFVTVAYSAAGGILADIWTDLVQVIVFVVGAVWALVVLLFDYPGGPASFFTDVPAERFSLGVPFSWDLSLQTAAVVFLYGLSENLRNYGVDQNYVQRILCAQDDRAAKLSIWFGAITYLPVSAVFCLIGTGLFMFYHAFPERLVDGLRAEDVFPYFMAHELPPAVQGLLISAIMAAAMSTIDSSLGSMSTLMLVDVFRPLFGQRTRVPEIVVLRGTTVLFGILGSGGAAAMYLVYQQQSNTVMNLWWQWAGTVGGGMFGLFLLAWLMPRLPAWGAAIGVLSTIPVLAWGTFCRPAFENSLPEPFSRFYCPLHPNLVGISATATMLLVAAVVMVGVQARLFAPNSRPHPLDAAG